MIRIVLVMCKINHFSLSKKVTNILEKLVQAWPRVFIASSDLLRKTLTRPSLAIIIDISKENKVSVLAEDRNKDIAKSNRSL